MRIHRLSVDEALKSAGSSAEGLSSAEALRRLREYGPNRIEKVARRHPVLRLLREFIRFFSVILWIATALAFVAEWFDPGQGMAHVGYAVIGVILVSGVFSFWQEYRIEQTLAALRKLLPQRTRVFRDGSVVELTVDQLVVGDIVMLEQGDNVPADCRLVEAFAVRANTATVTGEAISRSLTPGPSEEEELIRSKNVLLAGTSVVSGRCRAVVYATGAHTEFGKIAQLAQTSSDVVSPLRKQLAHLSRLIAVLSVLIGASFFAIGAVIGVPIWQDAIFSIGIIVAMVPEGLLPTLTLALVLAAQRMAKRNVLIRDLTSVETLGFATVICTDKTGTLTENRMQVRQLLLGQRRHSAMTLADQPELIERYRDFFVAASLCHDLRESTRSGRSVLLGDPMEIALADMGRSALLELPVSRRIDEIPFDADRKRQSVVHETSQGPVVYCKGALEAVLPLCTRILSAEETQSLESAMRKTIHHAEEEMAAEGLRILAFASKRLSSACATDAIEQDLVFQGLVGLEDPPRPEVSNAIGKCREAGIKVIMITGDHPLTATAIAREIGLVRSASPQIITGEQLQRLAEVALRLALDADEIIFARMTPEQKMRIVEALRAKGHVVAVTGDGVNDAPALKAAHIGIAMGIAGTDVAKEAADMVLADDNFASIVNAVEEGRAVFQNIRKFLTYVLVHNVAELVPYLAFALFTIPLPLTPIQVLFVDMGTDSLTALGLGVERPDPQAMRLPPRPQDERLLNVPLALRAYLFLGSVEAAAAMGAFFFVLLGGGWRYGQSLAANEPLYLRATTACLTAIIVMQIVNVFLCRSSVRSVFSPGLFDNRLIAWGVVLEIALALMINYTSVGNWLLDTAPVPGELWLLLIASGAGMLALEELRKWIARKILRNDHLIRSTNRCRGEQGPVITGGGGARSWRERYYWKRQG
jgi:sodium/potassium-transporting ATPase subunit alpha